MDNIQEKIILVAASIMDRIYPEIVKAIEQSIIEEFSENEIKKNFFNSCKKSKHLDLLIEIKNELQENATESNCRNVFYKRLGNDVPVDTKRKAFVRSWKKLVEMMQC